MLIDIGVNLMHPSFDKDREQIVEAAADAGVSPLVITGTGETASRKALLYAARFPGKLCATAGVHPHEARFCNEKTIPLLRELAAGLKAAAVGECGLDYNRDFSPRKVQREWFEKQTALAAELGLPLFLHEREASSDFAAILKNAMRFTRRAVVHCFTGTAAELETYLSLGCYIGITGWICDERRGAHLAEIVKMIPAGRLMLETDSPFLVPRDLPREQRRSRNEPRLLPHIAEAVARRLGKDKTLLEEETYSNSKRFFGI